MVNDRCQLDLLICEHRDCYRCFEKSLLDWDDKRPTYSHLRQATSNRTYNRQTTMMDLWILCSWSWCTGAVGHCSETFLIFLSASFLKIFWLQHSNGTFGDVGDGDVEQCRMAKPKGRWGSALYRLWPNLYKMTIRVDISICSETCPVQAVSACMRHSQWSHWTSSIQVIESSEQRATLRSDPACRASNRGRGNDLCPTITTIALDSIRRKNNAAKLIYLLSLARP